MSDKASSRPMAAVGSYDTVLPFQAVGVKPFAIKDADKDNVASLLEKLARADYAVIFVEESCYVDNSAKISEINEMYAASIIPIPGIKGSIGIGLDAIRNNVERAVGMDIFSVK